MIELRNRSGPPLPSTREGQEIRSEAFHVIATVCNLCTCSIPIKPQCTCDWCRNCSRFEGSRPINRNGCYRCLPTVRTSGAQDLNAMEPSATSTNPCEPLTASLDRKSQQETDTTTELKSGSTKLGGVRQADVVDFSSARKFSEEMNS